MSYQYYSSLVFYTNRIIRDISMIIRDKDSFMSDDSFYKGVFTLVKEISNIKVNSTKDIIDIYYYVKNKLSLDNTSLDKKIILMLNKTKFDPYLLLSWAFLSVVSVCLISKNISNSVYKTLTKSVTSKNITDVLYTCLSCLFLFYYLVSTKKYKQEVHSIILHKLFELRDYFLQKREQYKYNVVKGITI